MTGEKESLILLLGLCFTSLVLCQEGSNGTSTTVTSTAPSPTSTTTTPTPTPTTSRSPQTSTSTPQETTTAKPSTTAKPFNGFYELKWPNDTVCVRATMTAVFAITYKAKEQTTNATVTVPKSSKVGGECSETRATMTLSWEKGYQFNLSFEVKTSADSEKSWALTSMALTYDPSVVTNSSTSTPTTVQLMNTSITSSFGQPYSCKSNLEFVFKAAQPVNLQLSELTVQAFQVPEKDFGPDGTVCVADVSENKKMSENNVIPVAVAGTLAALILIIIVAYFVMKARNNNQYKPME
ncbi:lysosome-associated membrane glycoprotein 1 isoform X2 [Lingula anatina]|uniref:Lysosome-associated membrane glycoprotein 5 n=1 Tax=Lingula anatina TaxID=7574 RepID=A0A1S3JNF1_LINAN|nr:lysosome-associated membrane glycoprotein 1 isoform X2 [Lingula anatina]|eukprot:XP_013411479.1 lysosome-associated membrane glycoprotein 1 isoform X2 [Lingula anatina]